MEERFDDEAAVEHFDDEVAVVESTRRDINKAIRALRTAVHREDSELGPDGIGRRLAEIGMNF
jgi:hypothetical protein